MISVLQAIGFTMLGAFFGIFLMGIFVTGSRPMPPPHCPRCGFPDPDPDLIPTAGSRPAEKPDPGRA